jgi:ABC-type phosphate transport system substrate-binding protein
LLLLKGLLKPLMRSLRLAAAVDKALGHRGERWSLSSKAGLAGMMMDEREGAEESDMRGVGSSTNAAAAAAPAALVMEGWGEEVVGVRKVGSSTNAAAAARSAGGRRRRRGCGLAGGASEVRCSAGAPALDCRRET